MAKNKYSEYATGYSDGDYIRDEKSFNEFEKSGKPDWAAFSRLMMRDILTNTDILDWLCWRCKN